MHTVFALLCFAVVIHWLIFPYPSGLLHLHCGNLTIAPMPAKQPWWIWINTSCEFIMNDCITTTKQSTTKPCAYFLGYTICNRTTPWAPSHHLQHPRAGMDPIQLWHGWLLVDQFYFLPILVVKLLSFSKSIPLLMKYMNMSIVSLVL